MNKTNSITFRVSDHDKKSIVARAKKGKMKTSDFCRYAVLGKEVRHIEGLKELIFELNKIGNNLNQLTVLCHQRRVDNPNLEEITYQLNSVFDVIVMVLGGDDYSNC
ncbi:MAG: MobC family plasmid mobilization relaxosome protein [Eubacteriales bacterium]